MLLQRHGISMNQEDIERVDTMRYLWQNLQTLVSERLTHLLKVQPQFESTLLENVVQFKKDVDHFVDEYNEVREKEREKPSSQYDARPRDATRRIATSCDCRSE